MRIWVPVEVSERQLARVTGKDKRRSFPGIAEEDKPEAPQFERMPSWFGYTVRRKSEAA